MEPSYITYFYYTHAHTHTRTITLNDEIIEYVVVSVDICLVQVSLR